MPLGNTENRWGAVQQTLHWLIVLAAITQITLGFTFASLPEDEPLRGTLFGAHATVGLLILVIMLVRLVWRLAHPVPKLPDTLQPWEKRLARLNHGLLYLLLIGLPMGGYLLVNAHGSPVPFFDLQLPVLMPPNETLEELIELFHVGGALLLIVLVILHAAAALRHEWVIKDNTLRRMTPLSPR